MRKKISVILIISIIFTLLSTNIAFSETGVIAIEKVDSEGDVGHYTSLSIDSNGTPHISYFDYEKKDLKYAYKDNTGWHVSTVDSDGTVGEYNSIAIDSNNNTHISYFDYTNYDLKYAYKDENGWKVSTVDSASNEAVGFYTSLAIDSNGYPHIIYYDFTYKALRYAYKYKDKDEVKWHVSTIDNIQFEGMYTSIAIDSNNNPHISYLSRDVNSSLHYAYKNNTDNTGWHVSTVDGNSHLDVGRYPSLAIDNNENPHISYYDSSNGDLKYAYKNNTDNTGWHVSTVDSNGNVGHYTSLAIDSNSNLHISYYDYTNKDLKCAYKDKNGWHISTIDSYGNVGEYTSIAIDSNENPHISYYDSSNYDLKYVSIYPNINIDTNINIGSIEENEIHEEILEITNDGLVGLNITNIVSSSPYLIVEDITGQTIYPGETIEVQVLMSPTEVGTYSETLEIHSNDPDVITVNVSGQVTHSESNADLKSLSITNETLDKEFDSDISVYEITTSNNLDSIEINTETVNPLSTVNINDEVSTGTTTKTISLNNGENLIPVVVTSQDGTTEKAYVISINGTINDADLIDLKVNDSTVNGFDRDNLSYTIDVNNDIESIDISAILSDDNAIMLIDNSIYKSGNRAIDLEVGENIIDVMVVAQDSTTKTYTLVVNRGTANANLSEIALSSGSLNETFDPFTYSYTATVNNSVDNITITPTTVDSNAIVKVNGKDISTPVDLEVGKNTVTIEVTGADGISKKTYEIIITRREALEITNNSLPIGIIGGSYNAQLNAEGGKAPYIWSETGLPDGLVLDATTGEITGTPTKEGEYTVNIKVVDATGIESTKTLDIKINLGCGNGGYIITTENDPTYTNSFTDEGIFMMTVNEGVTGFKYFSALIEPVTGHDNKEVVIFIHTRNGKQVSINATRADFDLGFTAEAAFNVQPGDVIKVFIVDKLSNDINHSPSVL